MPHNPTPNVSCKYGAPMGRRSHHSPGAECPKLYLRRIYLDSGGYDAGGAYWGFGAPLYWYADDSGDIDGFLRAAGRNDAKRQLREEYEGARFFR